MAEEKGRRGPSRTEAANRYANVKPRVKTLSELSEEYPTGGMERQPPDTLYTGTWLEYAKEVIQRYGAFRHDSGPVFYSENFEGAAAPASFRASQVSSRSPIVMIVDTRVPGVNAKWSKQAAGTHFVSDEIPLEAIIATCKVNANLDILERVDLV